MISDTKTDLAGLMPTERLFVMDLLERVRIDVAPWRVRAEGRPVKKPRANDGPDHPSNVVAICPRDHRRAHFAAERDEIAVRLKEVFASVDAGLHRENYATQQ